MENVVLERIVSDTIVPMFVLSRMEKNTMVERDILAVVISKYVELCRY